MPGKEECELLKSSRYSNTAVNLNWPFCHCKCEFMNFREMDRTQNYRETKLHSAMYHPGYVGVSIVLRKLSSSDQFSF